MNIHFDTTKAWAEVAATEVHALHGAKKLPSKVEQSEDKAELTQASKAKAESTAKATKGTQEFQESIQRVRAKTRSLIDALRKGEDPFGAQMKTQRESIESLLG